MKHPSPKNKKPIGWWVEGASIPETGNHAIKSSVLKITEPVILLDLNGQIGIGRGGDNHHRRECPLCKKAVSAAGICTSASS